jgi:molybdopterin converting factor small subunit
VSHRIVILASEDRGGAGRSRTMTGQVESSEPAASLGALVSVDVRLPTVLRPAAGGAATVAANGATVGDILDSLVAQHPALRDQVLTPEGELHRHLNVFLNDDDIRYLGRRDARVAPGDSLTLMPAVAGG